MGAFPHRTITIIIPKLDHWSIDTHSFEGMPNLEKYLEAGAKPSIILCEIPTVPHLLGMMLIQGDRGLRQQKQRCNKLQIQFLGLGTPQQKT